MSKEKIREVIHGLVREKTDKLLDEMDTVGMMEEIHNRLFDEKLDDKIDYVVVDETDKVYGQKVIDDLVDELTDYVLGRFKITN